MSDPLDAAQAAMKFAAPNPGESASWYESQLGFAATVYMDGDYAIVRRGKLTLHLWKCEDRKIAENTSCYVEMDSVSSLNQLHAEWRAIGDLDAGRIEEEPKDQTGHGMREFHVWDPAGNLLGFGAEI